ncbi:hypothetical protein L798_00403 [Zootermopsis nevadensis]|uniref:Uncharacterized protein n=1 Tax=Zootermopsis nevadensis TaxID=136037 RepID=A0A067QL97_ZOONE|nr:hypothetical protein L798_00403 [Zootermopsis nevadensis]
MIIYFAQFQASVCNCSMQEGRTLVAESRSEIKRRYEDTSLAIFKEQQQNKHASNFLTFGTSRRTYEYSNNGNSSVIVRKPDELLSDQKFIESQVCVLL